MSKKATTFILSNKGLCSIYFGGERYMPGEEFEVTKEQLENQGIRSLIVRGDLVVKDNADLNDEIIETMHKKRKASPTEGKSLKQLEDGGEY